METKPSIIIEDFSALGQISLVAATTILQAMGITTACLPATLLSTQTEGLGTSAALSTAGWQRMTVQHWVRLPLSFQGALVGYLGSMQEVRLVWQTLQKLAPGSLMVDPVMADQGQLYPGLDAAYPAAVRKLCQAADVITPNWTELCLLADLPVSKQPSERQLVQATHALRERGITAQLVVTGIVQGQKIGCWSFHSGEIIYNGSDYFPGHFYGTGDCFAALLHGYLLAGNKLLTAISMAEQALTVAVKETNKLPATDRLLGMRLTDLVTYLTRES